MAIQGRTVAERIRAHSTITPSGCIEWTGTRTRGGYGSIKVDGAMRRVPRVAWALAHGPIPEGMHVLHKCDNPPCCNVEHLFLGTNADNIADRIAKRRNPRGAVTHCPKDHEYTDANTRLNTSGDKVCRICDRARGRAYYWANRDRIRATQNTKYALAHCGDERTAA